MAARKLTPKQEKFCQIYVKEGNATEAFRQSYGPRKSEQALRQNASRLTMHPLVHARINELRAATAKQVNVDTVRVLFENAYIGLIDPLDIEDAEGNIKPLAAMKEETRRAIAGVKVTPVYDGVGEDRVFAGYKREIKFWDKGAALERFFKHFGMYEKDNRQKADPFADLPRERVKELVDYIHARLPRPTT